MVASASSGKAVVCGYSWTGGMYGFESHGAHYNPKPMDRRLTAKYAEQQRQYRADNSEKIKAAKSQYYQENKEARNAYWRAWYKKNAHKVKMSRFRSAKTAA